MSTSRHARGRQPGLCPLDGGVAMCVCTIAIGPSKFDKVDAKGHPTGETKNFCIAVTYNRNSCSFAKNGYKRNFMRKHAQAIATYWKKQLGDAVSQWRGTAKNLEPMVENHKR